MILPSAQQYIELIRTERNSALSFLRPFQFELAQPRPDKAPFIQGQNSVIFRANHSGKDYAVRFFTNTERDSFRRWSELSFFLSRSSYSWKTEVNFLEEEILVEGQHYPALLMPWVEATPLRQFIDDHLNDPHVLRKLQVEILQLWQQLEQEGIAHGDLNLEHILVEGTKIDRNLRLIGYDAMFIPPFDGLPSLEVGTPGFQHPMRMANDFYPELDRFSVWIFLAGLEALATDPGLWKGGADTQAPAALLFSYRDLTDPDRSLIFRNLAHQNNDALKYYLSQLRRFAGFTDLREIEKPELYLASRHRKLVDIRPEPAPRSADRIRKAEVQPSGESTRDAEERSIPRSRKEAASFQQQASLTKPYLQTNQKRRYIPENDRKRNSRKALWIGGSALLALAIIIIAVQSGGRETPSFSATPATIASKSVNSPFGESEARGFLTGLYSAYNKRNLEGILRNYNDRVDYYDASEQQKSALRKTIRDLFIAPRVYSVAPDFTTLQVEPSGDTCTISITIRERLQAKAGDATEQYDTKVRYVVDRNFRIVSEKSLE